MTNLAHGCAIVATLAIKAQIGAFFTDTAIRAKSSTFTAVVTAVVADGHAIGAVFMAPTTQSHTVFTETAIQTQLGTGFTGAAIGAEHGAFAAEFTTNRTRVGFGKAFFAGETVVVVILGTPNAHMAGIAEITANAIDTQVAFLTVHCIII